MSYVAFNNNKTYLIIIVLVESQTANLLMHLTWSKEVVKPRERGSTSGATEYETNE